MRLPGRPPPPTYVVTGPTTTFLRRGWSHHDKQVTAGLALSRAPVGLAYIVRQREDHWHLRLGALGEGLSGRRGE